jgi:cytochrome c oxidase assembly protein subunit 15
MDGAFLQRINSQRLGVEQPKPITAFQIGLQMAHRLVALSIVLLVGNVAWRASHEHGVGSLLVKLALAWACIVCVQAALGALTIWSQKAADIATAHVLLGALSLLGGTILSGVMIACQAHPKADPEYGLTIGPDGLGGLAGSESLPKASL